MSLVPYSHTPYEDALTRIAPSVYRYSRAMLRGTRARSTGPVGSVLATKSDVLRLYRTVQSRRPELKFRDFPLVNLTLSAGSVISTSLTDIPQGVTRNDRIGSKILIKGIQIRGRSGSSGLNAAFPTMMVLRSYNNTAPAISDFNTQLGCFVEPREYKEHLVYHVNGANLGTSNRSLYFKRGFMIRYGGTAATTAIGNKFYLALINPLAGNTQNVSLAARVWYTDS